MVEFSYHWTSEAYLEPSRTSTTKLFCENNSRLKTVNYFRKKAQDVDVWLGTVYASELQYVVCISNSNIRLVSFYFSFPVISNFTCLELSIFPELLFDAVQGMHFGRETGLSFPNWVSWDLYVDITCWSMCRCYFPNTKINLLIEFW